MGYLSPKLLNYFSTLSSFFAFENSTIFDSICNFKYLTTARCYFTIHNNPNRALYYIVLFPLPGEKKYIYTRTLITLSHSTGHDPCSVHENCFFGAFQALQGSFAKGRVFNFAGTSVSMWRVLYRWRVSAE